MLKKFFKNHQLFISYESHISKVERYYPVINLKKGMKEDVELDLVNLHIQSKSSPKKGIDIIINKKLYKINYGEMISVNTEHGVLSFRIINDWTFNTGYDFPKFFYYSIVAHIAILMIVAFPKLLKADTPEKKEDKKTEERVEALLEKIEKKNPKKKKVKVPKKEVKKIVVQKKEKKVGVLDFSKKKKKRTNRKRKASRSSYKNTSGKVTKSTNGGGGKVTSKNVSKSLDFLGGSNNSGKVATKTNSKAFSGARGFGGKGGIPVKGMTSDSKVLKAGGSYSGPINTTGVRGVKSAKYKGSGTGGGRGYAKSLNNVEGRVSAKTLGGSNKGSIGGTLRKAGSLRVTGGRISQKDIQKAINKKLYRLTYCYEKALLSKPNLSGVIKIQWTITTRRKVKNTKIVKSQMKDNKLHRCLMKEIKKIRFPRPKGGDATVIYPFKFKPTL